MKNFRLIRHGFVTMRLANVLFGGLVLLLVNACSVAPQKSSPDSAEQALQDFPAHWTINGRISLVHKQDNWYARFNWIQRAQDFQIRFSGPLGETELELRQVGADIHLKTPAGQRSSNDLEQLLWQETGWKFPVNSLRYWSYGRPNPNLKAELKYNDLQQISDIYQAGWHIHYPKRMAVAPYVLPKKIVATEQDVKIKIIITNWLLGDAALELDDR